MTRIALIGYGPWARNIHRTIDALRDVELHSVCRLHPEFMPIRMRDRVLVTSNLRKALDGADAAIIATHPSSHRELALACIGSGFPTMLEKPVALSFEDSDAIFDASEKSGVPLLIDNVYLFSQAFETLRDVTSVWSPVEIFSEGGSFGPLRDYSALLDYGPHDVSMALSILRESVDLSSVRRIPSESGELYEVRLATARGTAILKVGTGFISKRRRFEIRCGGRVAVYDDMSPQKLMIDGRRIKLLQDEPLKRAILSLHRFVSRGVTDWHFSIDLNRSVMRVLLESNFVSP